MKNNTITNEELSQLLDLTNSIQEMLNSKTEKQKQLKQAYVTIGNINLKQIVDRLTKERCGETLELDL